MMQVYSLYIYSNVVLTWVFLFYAAFCLDSTAFQIRILNISLYIIYPTAIVPNQNMFENKKHTLNLHRFKHWFSILLVRNYFIQDISVYLETLSCSRCLWSVSTHFWVCVCVWEVCSFLHSPIDDDTSDWSSGSIPTHPYTHTIPTLGTSGWRLSPPLPATTI